MSRMALVIAFVLALIGPASAQKAEIEAASAKYTEFYNKGDFAGIASLYTDDAIALPNGSAMVQGRAAIEAMWKGILAEHVGDPKLTTLDVKPLGPSAAREIAAILAIFLNSCNRLWGFELSFFGECSVPVRLAPVLRVDPTV